MDGVVAADELKRYEVDGLMNIMGMPPAINRPGAWLNTRPTLGLGLDRVELRFGQDDTETPAPDWIRYAKAREAIGWWQSNNKVDKEAHNRTMAAIKDGTLDPTIPSSRLLRGVPRPEVDNWQAYYFNHLSSLGKYTLLDSAAAAGDLAVVQLCLEQGAKLGPRTFGVVLENYANTFRVNTQYPAEQEQRRNAFLEILELMVERQPTCVNTPMGGNAAKRLGPKATPLCLAIDQASLPAVQFLLDHDADRRQVFEVNVTGKHKPETVKITPVNFLLRIFNGPQILFWESRDSLRKIYELLEPDANKRQTLTPRPYVDHML